MRATLAAGLIFLAAGVAFAQAPLNASATMKDNLSALMAAKKPVTVVLQNGQSYRATIGSVSDHLVVLNGPSQKEFYDVLIPIRQIAAIEVRVREQ